MSRNIALLISKGREPQTDQLWHKVVKNFKSETKTMWTMLGLWFPQWNCHCLLPIFSMMIGSKLKKKVSESVFEAAVKGRGKVKETDISANQFYREKNSKAKEKGCLHHWREESGYLQTEKERRKKGLGLRESLSSSKRIWKWHPHSPTENLCFVI